MLRVISYDISNRNTHCFPVGACTYIFQKSYLVTRRVREIFAVLTVNVSFLLIFIFLVFNSLRNVSFSLQINPLRTNQEFMQKAPTQSKLVFLPDFLQSILVHY